MNIKYIYYIILFLIIANSTFCFGQDTSNYKCEYYSQYPKEMYQQKIDSIQESFLSNKKYNNLLFIGLRSYATASCLFIAKHKNKYIGFFYDFMDNTKEVYQGDSINKLAKQIIASQSCIKQIAILNVPFFQQDSDGYGYIISTTEPIGYVEICTSQLGYANIKHININYINNILNLYSVLEKKCCR